MKNTMDNLVADLLAALTALENEKRAKKEAMAEFREAIDGLQKLANDLRKKLQSGD